MFLIIFISLLFLTGSHVALAADFYPEQTWVIGRSLFVNLFWPYALILWFLYSIIQSSHWKILTFFFTEHNKNVKPLPLVNDKTYVSVF